MSGNLDTMHRWALISPCKRYRYSLGRRWEDCGKHMVFIMLNPSTADGKDDDPTIRRCMSFAKRENCSSIEVVNLFALRATDPKELSKVDFHTAHGGNQTTDYTFDAIRRADIVVAGWGANKEVLKGWEYLLGSIEDFAPGTEIFHLGPLTKEGHPRHPLYLPKSSPLNFWLRAEDTCKPEGV